MVKLFILISQLILQLSLNLNSPWPTDILPCDVTKDEFLFVFQLFNYSAVSVMKVNAANFYENGYHVEYYFYFVQTRRYSLKLQSSAYLVKFLKM